MNKENIKIKVSNKKTVPIGIRISPALSNWVKEKKYSPTGIFFEACKDLGFKDEKGKEE